MNFKYNILFQSLLICFLFSCGNKPNEIPYNKVNFQDDERRAFLKKDNSPVTGKIVHRDSTDKIWSEFTYNNGFLELVRIWYSDSALAIEGNYKNGLENGLWKTWNKNGKVLSKKYFSDGMAEGSWESCYENGKALYTISFRNGLIDGTVEYYYKNGKINGEFNYNKGKEHGDFFSYYEDGTHKSKTYYINGKEEGEWKTWHKNGNLATETFYKNGIKNGEWKQYNEKGDLICKENWINNKCTNFKFYDDISKFDATDKAVREIDIEKLKKGESSSINDFNIDCFEFMLSLSDVSGDFQHTKMLLFFYKKQSAMYEKSKASRKSKKK
jgi:antitoxin component YwqK of YwqJK toxin-antitoxin module